ncbi:hypothetical protein DFH06DRAFT_1313235 [Mycena polygramma]|nr:hypothetical protein DFH06DRAFT_1313235 [Mycena polygramma]
MSNDTLEDPSRVASEFYSATSDLGHPVVEPSTGPTVAGPESLDDVAPPMVERRPLGPLSPNRRASSASRAQVEVVMQTDDWGDPFLVHREGYAVRIVRPSESRSATSGSEDSPGVPRHHAALFGNPANPPSSSPPPQAYSQVSPPPASYENTTMSGADQTLQLPELELDLDPNVLTSKQIGQLNVIRAHLGTANARLTASTAIIAEQQAATEDVHDTIQSVRAEVVSRLDSLKNEVNSQRARLNRCLDDNLRTLTDNGASTHQVNKLLEIMNRNNGEHRLPREVTHPVETLSTSSPNLTMPPHVVASTNALIPPRAPHETLEEFEKRAGAVLRIKEQAHRAFPLPEVPPREEVDQGLAPTTQCHTELNSCHPSTIVCSQHEIDRLERQRAINGSHARFQDGHSVIDSPAPSAMATSISGYRSTIIDGRDVMTDFADDMSEVIRTTIEHRIGERIELPLMSGLRRSITVPATADRTTMRRL